MSSLPGQPATKRGGCPRAQADMTLGSEHIVRVKGAGDTKEKQYERQLHPAFCKGHEQRLMFANEWHEGHQDPDLKRKEKKARLSRARQRMGTAC